MMTSQDQSSLSIDEARDLISKTSFRFDAPSRVGRVGLEPEFFPIDASRIGQDGARIRLRGERGGVELVEELARTGAFVLPRESDDVLRFLLKNGGNVTFEPGGQIEHSTTIHESAGEALADVEAFLEHILPAADVAGITFAALGTDIWHPVESMPLQLDHWRYRSMQATFDRRGVFGRVMMRHTATTQINLDLGPRGVAEERYLLANLSSPLVTASFACSPTLGAAAEMEIDGVCARALAWQGLEPSRTGFPQALVKGEDSFESAWTDAVLAADVMLFRTDDGATTGEAGFSFGRWIEEGHPVHGKPTREDLEYHMTTVFFEVRARGFLELRAADGLPSRFRAAPVVFSCGLLYDDQARTDALGLLDSRRAELDTDWQTAAREGVGNAGLRERAESLWQIALRGAEALPSGFFREADLQVARDYVERFIAKGRMPGDELREAWNESPERALAWARESLD